MLFLKENKLVTLLLFVLVGAFLLQCKKDTLEIVPAIPDEIVDTDTNISHVFYQRGVSEQRYTYDNEQGAVVVGLEGTIIKLTPHTFQTLTGQAVKGQVTVIFKEVYRKSDMVLTNTSTIAWTDVLVSGGMLHIRAEQDSVELTLARQKTVEIFMPTGNTQNESESMSVFRQDLVDTSRFAWDPVDTNAFIPVIDTLSRYYWFNCDFLNWINCDYFYGRSPVTPVAVTVPNGYNFDNTAVFLVFTDESAVTRINGYGQSVFSTGNGYNVPVGEKVTIVALSAKDGIYSSSFTNVTIENGHNESITFQETTLEEFVTELKKLN